METVRVGGRQYVELCQVPFRGRGPFALTRTQEKGKNYLHVCIQECQLKRCCHKNSQNVYLHMV